MGKADFRLYVVLDDARRRVDPAEAAAAAIEGGATVLQWSSGQASTRAQVETGRRLAEVSRRYGVPLVVGGRVDVMLAIGADGVLLGPDDLPAVVARRLAGSDGIIGVLARDPREALAAAGQGADFVLYARPAEVAGTVPVPVIALGVRSPEEVVGALQAGARGVALAASRVRQGELGAACRAFAEAIRRGANPQQFAAGARPLATEPPFGDGRPGFL
ncbi:MAG: thiamine phosphate synthase [Bacillota bacterium]